MFEIFLLCRAFCYNALSPTPSRLMNGLHFWKKNCFAFQFRYLLFRLFPFRRSNSIHDQALFSFVLLNKQSVNQKKKTMSRMNEWIPAFWWLLWWWWRRILFFQHPNLHPPRPAHRLTSRRRHSRSRRPASREDDDDAKCCRRRFCWCCCCCCFRRHRRRLRRRPHSAARRHPPEPGRAHCDKQTKKNCTSKFLTK